MKHSDDKCYKDTIINYLNEVKMAKKKFIRNLLASLKKNLLIETQENDRTCWVLKK